ncbi:MAG: phytanoyl-CoA dioxygenase family protein [Proteobacteria bacterium]|nr:phytanoyl-CoA dioxygenase family protein [Pseudomonadota bacterium]
MDYLDHYREHGYAVVRGVFGPGEISELAGAFERVYAQGLEHARNYRHRNVFFRVDRDEALGRIVRFVQWAAYFDPVLGRFRTDSRLFDIIEPIIGVDVKQIINQMHWKPPGAAMTEFAYHQDIHFRRPAAAYRSTEWAYVQTGIAVDPHRAENGAMLVYPGSHRLRDVSISLPGRVSDTALQADDLAALGLDPEKAVSLELDPGDVAFWNLYTIHGSGPNRASYDRKFYINGYVAADKCDRGEWAFRGGKACPLGEPQLVHYEDLYTRPEPHYPDDNTRPDEV